MENINIYNIKPKTCDMAKFFSVQGMTCLWSFFAIIEDDIGVGNNQIRRKKE